MCEFIALMIIITQNSNTFATRHAITSMLKTPYVQHVMVYNDVIINHNIEKGYMVQ